MIFFFSLQHPTHHNHNSTQAEDENISIVPNFNSNVLNFLNGDFGPFTSNFPTDVPIWLALALKERHKCRIEAPLWMTPDILKSILDEEQRDTNVFSTNLPFHYLEIAHVLFNNASDNIEDVDHIRTLIEDIATARATKLRKGANSVMDLAANEEGRDVPGTKMNGKNKNIQTKRRRVCVCIYSQLMEKHNC